MRRGKPADQGASDLKVDLTAALGTAAKATRFRVGSRRSKKPRNGSRPTRT